MSNLDRYLITYLDLFSGIGGFHSGLKEAGFKFAWSGYSEVDKYAKQIYQKHFPGSEDLGDVKTIQVNKLPKLDLISFGFPCQDLSIAGKRAGITASRSGLFFEAMRIVRDARPAYFIFENVKGLFSSSNGECWKTILKEIANAGYDGQWQLLNTRWFLPQNRERIYFIGHLRGERRPQIFPIGESNKNNDNMGGTPQGKRERFCTEDICPSLATGEKWKAFITPALSAGYYKRQHGQALCQVGVIGDKDSEATRVYSPKGNARTIKNGGGMGAKTGLYAVLTPDRIKKRQNGRRFKDNDEPSFILTGQDVHGVSDGIRIRRLTPLECERLQGFPDGWTEGISDTQRYKCLGNAVSVPVVKAIMERLKPYLAQGKMKFAPPATAG